MRHLRAICGPENRVRTVWGWPATGHFAGHGLRVPCFPKRVWRQFVVRDGTVGKKLRLRGDSGSMPTLCLRRSRTPGSSAGRDPRVVSHLPVKQALSVAAKTAADGPGRADRPAGDPAHRRRHGPARGIRVSVPTVLVFVLIDRLGDACDKLPAASRRYSPRNPKKPAKSNSSGPQAYPDGYWRLY